MTRRTSFAVLEGAISLHQAQRGDVSILLARLRSGDDLLPEERDFLADLVEGKRRRPQNRAGRLEAKLRVETMVEDVLTLRALNTLGGSEVPTIAAQWGVSPSYLYQKLREIEASPSEYQSAQRRAGISVEQIKAIEAMIEARRKDVRARWETRRLARATREA